jgi:hypothetical protein
MAKLFKRFVGVQEIVDNKVNNAARSASVSTIVIASFGVIAFAVLSLELSYALVPSEPEVIFFGSLLGLYWFINFIFYRSRLESPLPVTTNTNLSYESTRDFAYSLGFYSRSRAAANRALGIIDLYESGIRGFVTIDYSQITSVVRSTPTDVELRRRWPFGLGKLFRLLKIDRVSLRFSSAGDAEAFVLLVNEFAP